jgi:hypothetical protein
MLTEPEDPGLTPAFCSRDISAQIQARWRRATADINLHLCQRYTEGPRSFLVAINQSRICVAPLTRAQDQVTLLLACSCSFYLSVEGVSATIDEGDPVAFCEDFNSRKPMWPRLQGKLLDF